MVHFKMPYGLVDLLSHIICDGDLPAIFASYNNYTEIANQTHQTNFKSWYTLALTEDNDELQTTQPTRGAAVTAVWQTLCKLCRPLPITVFGANRPCGPAGWLAMLLIRACDVETNPGPTTRRKQVWISDICHRQIQVMKQ